MPKSFAIAAVAVALSLAALAQSQRTASEVQNATRGVPDSGSFTVLNSLPLGNVCGFRVSVCGEPGSVLTGGTLQGYLKSDHFTGPAANPDLTLTVGTPGTPCRVFPDLEQVVRVGHRVMFRTVAMTGTAADGGTLNTDGGWYRVRYDGWTCPE